MPNAGAPEESGTGHAEAATANAGTPGYGDAARWKTSITVSGEVLMDMDNVRRLVRWNDVDPTALAEQMLRRVQDSVKAGKTCGIIVCFVERNEETGGTTYDAGCSPLPVEVTVMASEIIRDKVKNEWRDL